MSAESGDAPKNNAAKRVIRVPLVDRTAGAIDALNLGLSELEARLAAEPMKLDLLLPSSEGSFHLVGFTRSGNSWVLGATVYDEEGNQQWLKLSTMSLTQKAELAKALPDYLLAYRTEQRRRSTLVDEALQALGAAQKIMEGA